MASPEKLSLHIVDYCIFLGMVVLCTGIGVVYGISSKGAKTKEAFFVANRGVHFIPVAISLLVTFQSAIMMLGTPAEVYIYGTSVLLMGLGSATCKFLGMFITVPLFRPLKLTSAFEYLQLRFNSRHVRLCGVVLNLASNLIYTGIVIYAPAVALQAVTGFNQWITIATLTASGVVFTAMGGIKSVIWTDVFQAIVMYTGVVVIIVKATHEAGGLSKVWEIANEGKRLDTFNFDPNPTVRHTFWTLYFPAFVRACRYVFDQSTVQRVSAASSDRGATLVMAIMAPVDILLFALVVFEGVAIYAYFRQQEVEPLSAGIITNPNQIVPYAVLVLFNDYPGMPGLFLAALFAASLSTLSSSLSTLSIIVMEDILQPLVEHLPDQRQLTLARITVVFLGLAACLFCVMASVMSGSLMQICVSLVSATTGPLIGIFLLGCFFPSSTSKGVLSGVLAGSCLCWILVLGQNFHPGVSKTPWLALGNQTYCSRLESNLRTPIFDANNISKITDDCVVSPDNFDRPFNIFNLSYNLTAMIGALTTLAVGLIFSHTIIGKNEPGDVNPAYFLPISDTWLIWLPRTVRRWIKGKGPQFTSAWEKQHNKKTSEIEDQNTNGSNASPLLEMEYCRNDTDQKDCVIVNHHIV